MAKSADISVIRNALKKAGFTRIGEKFASTGSRYIEGRLIDPVQDAAIYICIRISDHAAACWNDAPSLSLPWGFDRADFRADLAAWLAQAKTDYGWTNV